jgi:NitT/TauT family transport system permease protein
MISAILITGRRVACSFIASFALGILSGIIAGKSERFDAFIDPWIIIFMNLPMVIVMIFAYVWLGLTDVALICAVTITKVPAYYTTFREGVKAFDRELEDVARLFRLTVVQRLRVCILPQLLPYIVSAFRTGISLTWKIVLVAELLGRSDGVGYELSLRFQNFDLVGIIGYGICFAAVMLAVEYTMVRPVEYRLNAYR